jgi:hypothetical protein
VPNIKKILVFLLFLLLPLLFAACASRGDNTNNPPQEQTAENNLNENNEHVNPSYIIPNDTDPSETNPNNTGPNDTDPVDTDPNNTDPVEIVAERNFQSSFTSKWAKTATHFFFPYTHMMLVDNNGITEHQIEYALYRLPLNDISKGERVAIPGEGEIEIVGLNSQYLFIVRRGGDWESRKYNIYRISLSTLQPTLVDSGIYYGVPYFHAASNSVLFAHGGWEEGGVRLEALQLDTNTRHTFYEFESDNFFSFNTGWWPMEDNAVVFINSSWGGTEPDSDFILIDSELQARQMQRAEIGGTSAPWINPQNQTPQNPAEEFIFELGVHRYVTMGNWIYYILSEYAWEPGSLYRININGTQNTLLQNDLDVNSLLSVNNTLFAAIFPRPHVGEDSAWYEAVTLAADGSITKVLGGGWHGHNSGFGMQQLAGTDMVKIMQYSYFGVDGAVLGLYCTTTGSLFGFYGN